jgi:hypothetical protein
MCCSRKALSAIFNHANEYVGFISRFLERHKINHNYFIYTPR